MWKELTMMIYRLDVFSLSGLFRKRCIYVLCSFLASYRLLKEEVLTFALQYVYSQLNLLSLCSSVYLWFCGSKNVMKLCIHAIPAFKKDQSHFFRSIILSPWNSRRIFMEKNGLLSSYPFQVPLSYMIKINCFILSLDSVVDCFN